MKKITQLFLLLVVVFVTACNNTPKIVYLTDYLAKDQMEIDAMPAIREALDYCREVKAETQVLKETERKWEEGLVSVFQLMEARNRLLVAKAEKIRVRLQYELTSRLTMYYRTGSFINH